MKNPLAAQQDKWDKAVRSLVGTLPQLMTIYDDHECPAVSVKYVRRDDGGWLCIVERETGLKNEAMFAYGEDPVLAMLAMEGKLQKNIWKESKTYAQRQAELKKE